MDTPRIIDIHAHFRLDADEVINDPDQPIGAAGLMNAVRIDGVEHATAITIAHAGNPDRARRKNDAVLAAATETDGFLIPVVSVHPADGDDALAELDRVAGLGARMLKLHPNTQQFDVADAAVLTVVRAAGEHGMVVLFDGYSPFDPAQPGKFVTLAIQAPETRMILAHLNGPEFARLLMYEVIARYPWWAGNVYHDISATTIYAGSPYAAQLEWVIRKIGVDHILYGTDYPMEDPAAALRAFLSYGFTPEEQHQMLYANAAKLLDL
ncbi:MAG TPA: amidohydrolase family protein [Micromonosporaceae bacterium]|jgi:hypothetical protein